MNARFPSNWPASLNPPNPEPKVLKAQVAVKDEREVQSAVAVADVAEDVAVGLAVLVVEYVLPIFSWSSTGHLDIFDFLFFFFFGLY